MIGLISDTHGLLREEVRNCKITEVQIDGVKEGFLHINFLLV